MASVKKGSNNNNTPGRKKRTDNQYFEYGKVGRKTGITLADTGIRDEHGLEPMSGIFESPYDKTLTSEGMDVQESSAPDVTETLTQRKTPRLPPPRQSTPRHTNIGSPKRMSSTKATSRADRYEEDDDAGDDNSQLPANRRLNFGATNRNRKSISVVDTRSPFKPTKVLRRSTGPARPKPFSLPEEADYDESAKTSIEHTNGLLDEEDEDVERSIEQDDGPGMLMEDFPNEVEEAAPSPASFDSPPKRKRGRPRKSDQTLNSSQIQATPGTASSSQKRGRPSLEYHGILDESGTSAREIMGPPSKRKRPSDSSNVLLHDDSRSEVVDPSAFAHDNYGTNYDSGPEQQEAEMGAQLDSQLNGQGELDTAKRRRGRPKGKKGKAAVPKERDANRAMQKSGSPVKLTGSPSKGQNQRGVSLGPVSNVNLRASTPFEDSGRNTSRFGRNLIHPLKFWQNEQRIYKAGEIEGIVRAEDVQMPNRKTSKRRKKNRKTRGQLQDIQEESEAESVMPDEWEDEVGVISGIVATWDPLRQVGNPGEPVQEDLAFAAPSIVTRDVADANFKYAKIMTLPFFGAGVVELPPEGFKLAKNSRKMQMVFFVHEGKVSVDVSGTGMEVNSFTLSKGGCWVVPRGNNYSITNESTTRSAIVFFAQGCAVDSERGAADISAAE